MRMKKISWLMFMVIAVNIFSVPCYAMEIQNEIEEIPVLKSAYVDTTKVSLSISGKQASIGANVRTKTVADKISLTIELQKKTNDSWNIVKTWKKSSDNTCVSTFSKQHDLTKKGKYRVKLIGKIYKNDSCEKVTVYSAVKTY